MMHLEEPAEIATRIEQIRMELDKFDQTAEKVSRSKPAYAAALLGGAGCALLIGAVGHFADLTAATGVVGIPIGAAIGLLAWKGREGLHYDRCIEALSQSIRELRTDIDRLPLDVPQDVKQTLWQQYVELQEYRTEVAKLYAQRRAGIGVKGYSASATSPIMDVQQAQTQRYADAEYSIAELENKVGITNQDFLSIAALNPASQEDERLPQRR